MLVIRQKAACAEPIWAWTLSPVVPNWLRVNDAERKSGEDLRLIERFVAQVRAADASCGAYAFVDIVVCLIAGLALT